MEKHDESRLPLWAQTELRVLRMRVEEAKQQIAVRTGAKETNTYLISHDERVNRIETPLLPGSWIEFALRDGSRVRAYVKSDGKFNVNASGGRLHVLPNASNDIEITVERY